jgi:hypothetical protein
VTVCLSAPPAVDPDIHGFSGIFHDEEATPITDIDSTPRVLNNHESHRASLRGSIYMEKAGLCSREKGVVKVLMIRTGSRRLANNFVYFFAFGSWSLALGAAMPGSASRSTVLPVQRGKYSGKCPKTWTRESGTDARISDFCRPDRCSLYRSSRLGFPGEEREATRPVFLG